VAQQQPRHLRELSGSSARSPRASHFHDERAERRCAHVGIGGWCPQLQKFHPLQGALKTSPFPLRSATVLRAASALDRVAVTLDRRPFVRAALVLWVLLVHLRLLVYWLFA